MISFSEALLGTAAVYLGLLWGTRSFMRWQLRRRMYAWAGAAAAPGAGTAQDVAGRPVKEVPASRELSIEVINSAWSSDDGDTHAQLAREARHLLRLSCALDLVVLVAFVFPMTRPDTGDADWVFLMTLVLLVLPLRYAFHRRQYWVGGADPWKNRIFGRLGSPPQLTLPLWALHKLSSPALQVPLRWGLLATLCWLGIERVQAGLSWGWASVLVALAVATADLALWRKLRQSRGLTLLLLRVFHKDEGSTRSAVATFGGVLDSWLNFGTFFTVMDDMLLRFRSPMLGAFNVAVLVGLYFHLTFSEDRSELIGAGDLVTAGAAILVALAIDAWRVYRSGLARVVTDAAEIPRATRQTQAARGLDLWFRPVEVPCLNNTWYQTVSAIAAHADVVLMDLRGYSPDRTGCDVEVNLLFDAVALRRIVFMIEPGKLELIESLFERCWRELATTSPNLKLADPTVSVLEYPLDNETTKDRIAEKQILLEELLFRTTGRPVGHKEQAKSATRWVIGSVRTQPADAPGAQTAAQRSPAALQTTQSSKAGRTGLSAQAMAAVREALGRFEGVSGLRVGDGISARKSRNARKRALIPAEEELLALVDMTTFGSAKDCWAFTDVALRYHNFSKRYVVEYMYFPWRKFSARGLREVEVIAPDGTTAALDSFTAELPRRTALELLEAVSAAVAAHLTVFPAFGSGSAEPSHPTAELSPEAALAVRAVLTAAKGRFSVFVGNEISETKSRNARTACFIPPEEEIVALVDNTLFGSAKHCWAFTERALRYWNGMDRHVLEYKYFPARRFAGGRFSAVRAHASDGTVIKLDVPGYATEEHIAMLEAIKSAVCAEVPASAAEPPRPEGGDHRPCPTPPPPAAAA